MCSVPVVQSRKGDKFKVAITNSSECYIYVFGEETDGSSYVLFPYTSKHSAYCGITGTRLFPKDHSMVADELGNKDRIAVVVSKEKLNYNKLNQLINQSRQSTYAGKFNETLGSIVLLTTLNLKLVKPLNSVAKLPGTRLL